MKLKTKILSLVALASLSLPVHGQLQFQLVQFDEEGYSQTIDSSINGGDTGSGSGTLSQTIDISLDPYVGSDPLARVVLKIVNSSVSYDIFFALTDTGSPVDPIETIDSATVGGSTTLLFTDPTISSLQGSSFGLASIYPAAAGTSEQTLLSDTAFSVDETKGPTADLGFSSSDHGLTHFDSEQIFGTGPGGVTSSEIGELEALFKRSDLTTDRIDVDVFTGQSFSFSRSTAEADRSPLTAFFEGTDTGTVRIEYYTIVPEVSAASASSFFGLFLVSGYFLRRRRG